MAFGLINKSASALAVICFFCAVAGGSGGGAHAGSVASQNTATEVFDVPSLLREGKANTERNWIESVH